MDLEFGANCAQICPELFFEKKIKKCIFFVDSWYGFDLYTIHQRGRRAAGDNIARS